MCTADVELRIEGFLAKYSPAIAAAATDSRTRLQTFVPRGYELVYDNYNALVFGYGPSEKTSDAILSLAVYPRWVTLFFLKGASLCDPRALLQGQGTRVRSITLQASGDLDRPDVRNLIATALAPTAVAFADAPALQTVIKSVSLKQRPRRSQ